MVFRKRLRRVEAYAPRQLLQSDCPSAQSISTTGFAVAAVEGGEIKYPRAKDIGPSVQVRQRLRRGELKERKLQQAPELRLFRQRPGLRGRETFLY
jgi:hypothetical protein